MNNKVTASQLAAWLLVASIGPLLGFAGRTSWLTALVAMLVCGVVAACAITYGSIKLPRWVCAIQVLWLIIFLAGIAAQSETCWENPNALPVIGISLLLLSASGAQYGAQKTARACVVLLWLIVPVFVLVLIAGAGNVHIEWVDNTLEIPDGRALAFGFLPCLVLFLPAEQHRKPRFVIPIIGFIFVLATVWLNATMGSVAAQNASNGFYEYSKGVTLFGVAERFEAIIACVLTGSWFALFTIILSAVHTLTERVMTGWGSRAVWAGALIACVLMCNLHISPNLLAFGNLIFWGLLPLLALGIDTKKKEEKSEKDA